MSRPTQIEFLSRCADAYDPVVKFMGFASLWRAMAEVAAPSRGQPALDVCTGTGGAATELARRGARVIGLDLAEGMLRRARRNHSNGNGWRGSMFVRMDARRLAFPDHSFPLVTCSMALHEMAEVERQQVLQEISRVASNRVVIGEYRVPCGRGGGLLFRAARIFEYAESDDFESFVRSNLEAQFDRAGLVVQNRWDVGAYRIWPCQVRPT